MPKYRVKTKCYGCGAFYKTKAKPDPSAPSHCKHCGSTKTVSVGEPERTR